MRNQFPIYLFFGIQTQFITFSMGLRNNISCDCITSVLVQSLARNVHLFCALNSTFCPDIVNNIPGTTWTFYDSNVKIDLDFNRRDFCVIAAEDMAKILLLSYKLDKCYRANIILAFPPDVTNKSTELKTLFDLAWKLGIIDVVVIQADTFYCRVFTFIPFKEGACFDTSPLLINTWRRNQCNFSEVDYFPEDKISNLHLCKLTVEYNAMFGDIYTGSYALISFLNVVMNSTDNMLEHIHFDFPKIIDNSSDILLGLFYVTPSRLHTFVIPPLLEKTHSVLAVPHRPVSSVQWFRLVNELSRTVWYALLISFILSVICLFLMIGIEDFTFVILFALQSLLNMPCPTKILPWNARMYFSFWLLFCVVLNTTYLSTLLSKLSVSFTDEAISSIRDMAHFKVHLQFTSQFKEYALLIMNSNPEYTPLKDTVTYVNTSYVNMVNRNRTDIGYVVDILDFKNLFIDMPYRILPGEVFVGTATRVMLPRKSPYKRIFSKAVLKIFDAAAFDIVEKRFLNNSTLLPLLKRSRTAAKRLSLVSLAAVFILWFGGCILAFCVFIIENLLFYWSSLRKRD